MAVLPAHHGREALRGEVDRAWHVVVVVRRAPATRVLVTRARAASARRSADRAPPAAGTLLPPYRALVLVPVRLIAMISNNIPWSRARTLRCQGASYLRL